MAVSRRPLRQSGFSPANLYASRARYGGMEAQDAQRLNTLLVPMSHLRLHHHT